MGKWKHVATAQRDRRGSRIDYFLIVRHPTRDELYSRYIGYRNGSDTFVSSGPQQLIPVDSGTGYALDRFSYVTFVG